MTPGVVKVGETVRRPMPPASWFAAMVLSQLASAGFEGAPSCLGQDGRGRQILTFVPGEVPAKWRALAWSWCISSKPTRGPATEQARQVRVLAEAYGLSAEQRRRLPAAIEDRLIRIEMFWRERVDRRQRSHAGSAEDDPAVAVRCAPIAAGPTMTADRYHGGCHADPPPCRRRLHFGRRHPGRGRTGAGGGPDEGHGRR
jgi:hypothetical protein